jgi:penicillin-binding protein 1C
MMMRRMTYLSRLRGRRFRRFWLYAAIAVGVVCLFNWVIFPLPKDKLQRPSSTFVYSRDGHLLNCFTSSDRFWRKPVALERISPNLVRSVIACEDRWFYYHPGFNPVSLISAAVENLRAGQFVRGGSTITMQIARMMEPKSRTIPNKIIEILRAMQLELAFSKKKLLEIYFNLAPYGGNIEGVGTAAYMYFDKSPDSLSPAEAAFLTAVPSSPSQFRPDRDPKKCLDRRNLILRYLRDDGVISPGDYDQALKEELPRQRVAASVTAPHFCQSMASVRAGASEIFSTVDFKIQATCEQLVRGYHGELVQKGIYNLSVVVQDNRTGDLLAMVGSPDFSDVANHGQINGALAPRSPGSALKPFAYALGFEKGIISPALRVEDLPANYAGYIPVNYDNEYHGVVSVSEALIQSLNVPAVNLTSRVGLKELYDLLRRGGITTLNRKYFEYGLPLVLGSGEVTLLELTNLYATLARGGDYLPVRLTKGDARPQPTRLLTPEACYLVTELLAELKRPDLPASWEFTPDMPKVAWKTGTSYGRKDAWAVGYNPQYTVGVWAGNFSAEGSIAIVGAEIAAPLMLDIFSQLCLDGDKEWFRPPKGIAQREVCAVSGRVAGDDCPERILEHYIPGVSPTEPCSVHKKLLVDNRTGYQVCRWCAPGKHTTEKIYEDWPPRLAAWLAVKGIISLIPAHNPQCKGMLAGEAPVITSPESDAVYILRPSVPLDFQKILFEASAAADNRRLFWFLDGQLLSTTLRESRLFYEPHQGKHKLMCVDDYGRSNSIMFQVQ